MYLIDDFLNNITMYRLVLYFLIALGLVGLIFSYLNVLPFDPIAYIFSFGFILSVCWVTNKTFAITFNAPTNIESVWISALILALIFNPPKNIQDVVILGWAAVLSMSLKFIISISQKHIFNPVALSAFLVATFLGSSASWWIGQASLLPLVAIGSILIIRKIRRWDLVISFLIAALITTKFADWGKALTDTPLIFFAGIMLTEPLTTPPTRILRIIYGTLVGFLLYYKTPEMALVIGNIFSYIVSPKLKLMLKLESKIRLTPDTYDFIFSLPKKINYTPGQYMEFTLDLPKSDSRGNRRYLSLASSPTEGNLRLGVKFANPSSAFKKALFNLKPGGQIAAGQLVGDFTLPKNKSKKLAFIAGGIGITPIRSMLKYLIDKNEARDIVVLYLAGSQNEFVYQEILGEANNKLGIRTFYYDSGSQVYIDAKKLAELIPDYSQRTFYISGSHKVVTSFENILKSLSLSRRQLVTDYFPGFA